jgi:predicted esterase
MKTMHYRKHYAYELKKNESDNLIICIPGTNYKSVIYSLPFFIKVLGSSIENNIILMPERLTMKFGTDGKDIYRTDNTVLNEYTLEGLLNAYSDTINRYIDKNKYKSIILIGHSEGASLLPGIYLRLGNKDLVKGIVSMSYGGQSLYEQIKELATYDGTTGKPKLNDVQLEMCKRYAELRKIVIAKKDSLEWLDNYTYKWWYSFMDYSPVTDYASIDCPVLFIHGEDDVTVPVSSTRYVEKTFGDKNGLFEYYYDQTGDHSFNSEWGEHKMGEYISNWIKASEPKQSL